MLTKSTKLSGLISVVLMVGLLITGVTAFGGNNYESSEKSGLLEDTFLGMLEEKVGLEKEKLESLMDEAFTKASSTDERPIADNYLDVLAAELDMEVDQLRTLMTTTKTEAIDKLVSNGEIFEELGVSMKERASSFPFGYSYRGNKSKSGEGETTKGTQRGNRYGPSNGIGDKVQSGDGDGYGRGSGDGNYGQGVCDGEGPHGQRGRKDNNKGDGSGGRRNGN